MRKGLFTAALLLLLLTSCAELMTVLQSSVSPLPLTEDEVVSGLKEALITGSQNSAGSLSAANGYYGDAAVKILLPEEAKIIIDNISKIPGGEKLVEDVVLRINKAAEDAAREAAAVFAGSIRQMTVRDAFNILNGADNAATLYLKLTTYNELFALYKPRIEGSTSKEIIAGISVKESWDGLTGTWNAFAGSLAGRMAGMRTVNINLDDYLTNKALTGMFIKVEAEELKIRKEVSARISPLLKRVFGSLDNTIK